MSKKWNKIGWCQRTINPVIGCPNGCEYCYARSMNERFKWVEDFTKPQFFPHRLKDFCTKEPMIIFIDSMSDIAHWKQEWLIYTLECMYENAPNIYLALTKDIAKAKALKNSIGMAKRIPQFYIGATVTNNEQAQAVIDAGGADFISFEPLLERIEPELLNQLKCRWWIVGDLTKNGKPQGVTKDEWVKEIFCHAIMDETNEVPFFMKESLRESCESFIQEFPEGWKS